MREQTIAVNFVRDASAFFVLRLSASFSDPTDLKQAMLSTLVAIFIVLIGALVGVVVIWATFPQFPDFRLHAVTLAYKMWRKENRAMRTSEYAAALPPMEQLQRRMRDFAKEIDAPGEFLPKDWGVDFGWAQIEYNGKFRYSYVERGERYDVRETSDINEVLYWVFSDVTWAMASNYELIHRDPRAGDIRRLLFSHQLTLLRKLDPIWSDRRQQAIAETLAANPYVDCRAGDND